MPIAPSGMVQVHIADGSVTDANESAMKLALKHYAAAHNRDAKSLKVLGFDNASHGNSMLTLSVSDDAVNVGNIPTHDWPQAALPKTKYPYNKFEHENQVQEE